MEILYSTFSRDCIAWRVATTNTVTRKQVSVGDHGFEPTISRTRDQCSTDSATVPSVPRWWWWWWWWWSSCRCIAALYKGCRSAAMAAPLLPIYLGLAPCHLPGEALSLTEEALSLTLVVSRPLIPSFLASPTESWPSCFVLEQPGFIPVCFCNHSLQYTLSLPLE